MIRKDFIQLVSAGFSDPKMLARATADYYTRCRNRLLEKLTVLSDLMNGKVSESYNEHVVIQYPDINGVMQPALVNVQEMGTTFQQTLDGLSNELTSYDDVTCQIINHYTNEEITVNIQNTCQQLGDAADTLSLAIVGFESLVSEATLTASDFYQRVMLVIPEMNETVMNVCSDVYGLISTSSSSISTVYSLLNDYFGISQNMNRRADDPFELGDPAIEQYTGVNPAVALYSSLQLPNVIGWVVTTMHFIDSAVAGIFKWVGKGLYQVGKWFVNSVNTTFINPVDVETEGDTYEFFKNYSSMIYNTALINDDTTIKSSNLDQAIMSFFNDVDGTPRPIWFNFKVIAYQMTYRKNRTNQLELLVNRYIKPTDIDKFTDLLSSCGYIPDASHDDTGAAFVNMDWVQFFTQMQDTDLSCSKDASEKDVAAGLVLTNLIDRWLTEVFNTTKAINGLQSVNDTYVQDAFDDYLNGEVDSTMLPYRIDQWIRKYKGIGLSDILYSHLGIWCEDNETTRDDNQVINHRSEQNQLLERICNDQVTNKDFIQLVCCFSTQEFGFYWPIIHSPYNGTDWNLCYLDKLSKNPILGTQSALSILLTHLMLTEDMKLYNSIGTLFDPHLSEYFDGVYLAYSRGKLNITLNSSVKSDDENMNAAKNWMITAIVIVAAVVATIYLGVTVTKLVKGMRVRQALIDTNMRSIGMMMANGNLQDEVDALYKDTTKLMLKNKIIGALLGTTGSTATSTIKNAISSVSIPFSSSTNLDPIISLIRS